MGRLSRVATLVAAATLGLVLSVPAQGGFATIIQPDADYLAKTTKLDPGPIGQDIHSLSDGFVTVALSSARAVGEVPNQWGSWSEAPDAESATPKILYSVFDQSPLTATLNFNQGLTVFGLEIEPDSTMADINVDFYDGANLLGSIALEVDWNGGARLFAATLDGLGVLADDGTRFTKVVISSDDRFAFAQLRYFTPNRTVIPEPASLGLLGLTGIAAAWSALRRRRA